MGEVCGSSGEHLGEAGGDLLGGFFEGLDGQRFFFCCERKGQGSCEHLESLGRVEVYEGVGAHLVEDFFLVFLVEFVEGAECGERCWLAAVGSAGVQKGFEFDVLEGDGGEVARGLVFVGGAQFEHGAGGYQAFYDLFGDGGGDGGSGGDLVDVDGSLRFLKRFCDGGHDVEGNQGVVARGCGALFVVESFGEEDVAQVLDGVAHLGAKEDHDPRDVDPHEEDGDQADGAVDGRVVGAHDGLYIEVEAAFGDLEGEGRDKAADQRRDHLDLGVGEELIAQGEGDKAQSQGQELVAHGGQHGDFVEEELYSGGLDHRDGDHQGGEGDQGIKGQRFFEKRSSAGDAPDVVEGVFDVVEHRDAQDQEDHRADAAEGASLALCEGQEVVGDFFFGDGKDAFEDADQGGCAGSERAQKCGGHGEHRDHGHDGGEGQGACADKAAVFDQFSEDLSYQDRGVDPDHVFQGDVFPASQAKELPVLLDGAEVCFEGVDQRVIFLVCFFHGAARLVSSERGWTRWAHNTTLWGGFAVSV